MEEMKSFVDRAKGKNKTPPGPFPTLLALVALCVIFGVLAAIAWESSKLGYNSAQWFFSFVGSLIKTLLL